MKILSSKTKGIILYPFSLFHLFWASLVSLNTIVMVAVREPQPFVRFVLSRTVANVDSIGLIVRIWIQWEEGNS